MFKTREIFSSRLKEAIKNSSFNQRELSELLKVSTDTVQRWVHGKNLPSPDNMDFLCETLSVTPSWMLGGPLDSEIDPIETILKIRSFTEGPYAQIIQGLGNLSEQNVEDVKSFMKGLGAFDNEESEKKSS